MKTTKLKPKPLSLKKADPKVGRRFTNTTTKATKSPKPTPSATPSATPTTNTVKDFNGDEIKYFYNDETGKVLRKEFLSSGTSVNFNYDDTTRTETVIGDRGTTIYKYDELGRLISRKDPEGLYIGGDGASIEYVYEGNQLTVKTPNQTIVYEYNENGTLKSVTTPEGMTEYRYKEGQLVKTIFPNDTAEVIIYDELGRIDIIKTVKIEPATEAELEVLASYDYKVDAAGNREEVIDHKGRKMEYEYDELNRVTEEKITNPFDASEDGRTVTYTYDAVGNRLSKDDSLVGLTTYVYENNLLVQETQGDRKTIYDYDNNGNLTSRLANNTEETIYTWDDENRLVGVETPDGDIISYAYDENNIRVSSTVNGVKTNYVIDANHPYAQVLEEHKEGQLGASYVYGLDLISQQREGENYFYHVDGLGSTRALSNESGNLTDTYTYDAYGTLINSSGTMVNSYLFAGEQYDPNLDQYYLRQRYYDPQVGRFTRRDTYEGDNFDPITLHKYIYANANPVSGIDPSGLFTLTEVAAARQIRNTLASTQTQSYLNLVKESGEQGRKIANFSDLFLTTIDVVGNLRELIIGGLLIGSYLKKGSLKFWEKVVKYKMTTFEKLGSKEQRIANTIYDRFLQQFLAPGVGKPIHKVRNVNNLGDDLFEIKHDSGVRVYIDKHGNRLGYSMKGTQQNKVINKLKSFLEDLKNGKADQN